MILSDVRPGSYLRGCRLFAIVLVAGGAYACANVHDVAVRPPVACPGQNVTVSWSASGRVALAAVPVAIENRAAGQAIDPYTLAAGANFSQQPRHGRLTAEASQDTMYFVESTGWFGKPQQKYARLFVNQVLPLSGVPQCVSGSSGTDDTREVQAKIVLSANSRWSSEATTGIVENINAFTVTVRHDGRSAVLLPGGNTDIFTGTDPNSEWRLSYSWPAGPFCGQSGAPVPGRLSLRVHPLCTPAGDSKQ